MREGGNELVMESALPIHEVRQREGRVTLLLGQGVRASKGPSWLRGIKHGGIASTAREKFKRLIRYRFTGQGRIYVSSLTGQKEAHEGTRIKKEKGGQNQPERRAKRQSSAISKRNIER